MSTPNTCLLDHPGWWVYILETSQLPLYCIVTSYIVFGTLKCTYLSVFIYHIPYTHPLVLALPVQGDDLLLLSEGDKVLKIDGMDFGRDLKR